MVTDWARAHSNTFQRRFEDGDDPEDWQSSDGDKEIANLDLDHSRATTGSTSVGTASSPPAGSGSNARESEADCVEPDALNLNHAALPPGQLKRSHDGQNRPPALPLGQHGFRATAEQLEQSVAQLQQQQQQQGSKAGKSGMKTRWPPSSGNSSSQKLSPRSIIGNCAAAAAVTSSAAGESPPFAVVGNPLNIPRVVKFAFTNSEWKETEATLLKTIQDIAVPAVALADPASAGCAFLASSKSFQALTGYSASEAPPQVVGRDAGSFMPGATSQDKPLSAKHVQDAWKGLCSVKGVITYARKNGVVLTTHVLISPVRMWQKQYVIAVYFAGGKSQQSNTADLLKMVLHRIFADIVDGWMASQAAQFSTLLPMPYSLLLERSSPVQYEEELCRYISLEVQNVAAVPPPAVPGELKRDRQKSKTKTGKKQMPCAVTPGEVPASALPPTTRPTVSGQVRSEAEHSGADASIAGSTAGSATMMPQCPVRSKGSLAHPHNCVECQFYFFGQRGCKAGADCLYCHEFHERKNPKKNRRLLRRMEESVPCDSDESTSASGCPVKSDECLSTNTATTGGSSTDAARSVGASSSGASSSGSAPSGSTRHSTSAKAAPEKTQQDAVRFSLSYGSRQGESMSAVTLAVGQSLSVTPRLEMKDVARADIEPHVQYSIEPALPAGLELDAKTGAVRGVPTAQRAASKHEVAVSLPVTSSGGVSIGMYALTSCVLSLRVVDLRDYVICDTQPAEDSHYIDDKNELTLYLRRQAPAVCA
eukprot:TRINITY_DN4928_c0_g1_i1.p1 TRINITY_DN4928_c0_g1~~TRINITY_DN4928_c0_g1_i1.p1  ORF type:complete len:764 (+),score=160.04 TRINITY_DN4928_c0_g1_i1:126-2417(+)